MLRRRKHINVSILTALLICAMVPLTSCGGRSRVKAPLAQSGVLDLRAWNFDLRGPARLDGQWEFRWKRFMRNADFKGPGDARKPKSNASDGSPRFIPVPEVWNRTTVNGNRLPAEGFATYRLVILLPPGHQAMALKIQRIYTAYRIYANGKEIGGSGRVAQDRESSRPRYQSIVAPFQAEGTRVHIVAHVSNFHHRKGGIFPHILIGTEKRIRALRDSRLIAETFIVGGLVILGIYMLGLYFLRQLDFSPVYLGLFCLLMALRNSLENERLFMFLLPETDWRIVMKMIYLSFFGGVPIFMAYAHSLLKREFWRPVLILTHVLGLIFCIVVLATPVRIFSRLSAFYEIWAVLLGLYAVVAVLRAVLRRRESSLLFLASLILLFLATLTRIMFDRGWVGGVEITRAGFLAFAFIQAILVSGRVSRSFVTSARLSRELEKRVLRRTEELRGSRDELAAAKVKAEESNRAKSEFLAVMSHEIRTPLNAIIGTAEILSESRLDDEQKRFTRILNRAGNNLLNLINQVLDLSRADEDKLTLHRVNFNIRDVVQDVCEIIRVKADEKDLSLSSWIDGSVPELLNGDPDRLEQILINLMGNAVKFTDQGEISLRVTRENSQTEEVELKFSVRDTGRGIPEELAATIFDRFTQLDSSNTRRHGGTGLGLAITRKLVDLMHGRVWVESRLPTGENAGGSTFHFTARLQVSQSSAQGPVASPREPGVEWSRLSPRVLLVEDNQDNVVLVNAFLKKTRVRLETAENGLEAVARARSETFDLILMDIQMPVMDGLSATRQIREEELKQTRTATPIIALTAHAGPEDIQRSFAAGCDGHLTKPINKDRLLEAIYSYALRPDANESGDGSERNSN